MLPVARAGGALGDPRPVTNRSVAVDRRATPPLARGLVQAKRDDPARLSDKVGETLEEIAGLESELEFLEERLPPMLAELDAATRPLWDEIVATRQELVRLVERALANAPRRGSFPRDAQELVAHLAADLEERFGIRTRTSLDRPADAWSEDEEDPEIDDVSWADAKRFDPPPPRRTPERDPRRKTPDPETTAKGIYHSLARELHPDKTRDERERIRRTELMQNLTQAWRQRDLGALLRLLHAHGSDEAKSDAMDATSLKSCLLGLEETRDSLKRKVRDLRHQGLPGGVVDWMPILRDKHLFERLLRRQKSFPRQELEQMRHWKLCWSRPGGLERFFQEVPEEDWNTLV